MKKFILLGIFISITAISFAETIALESGNVVEGKIVDRNDDFIKVDTGAGIEITYYLDEIESIDGELLTPIEPVVPPKKPEVFERKQAEVMDYSGEESILQRAYQNNVLEKEPPLTAKIPTEVVSVEKNQAMSEYVNENFGVKFSYPTDWQVFDRDTHPDIFFSLGSPQQMDMVICALSPGKDWNNLHPLMMILGQVLNEDAKGLSMGQLAEIQNAEMQQLPPQANMRIERYPAVKRIGNKEVAHYLATQRLIDGDVSSGNYQIINGMAMYNFVLTTASQNFKLYEPVVDEIIGNMEFTEIDFANLEASSQGVAQPLASRNQSLAGLIWALLAILGGVYVLKNPKANNFFAVICFLYAALQIYYFLF